MTLALRVTFPHGSYHATSWDRAANAGDSEWPPSPWRLVRALLAVWHTRCPDIAADDITRLVRSLCVSPPEYLLPATTRSQTRHYLPQANRKQGRGDSTLTVDGRLHVAPHDPVWVRWSNVELSEPDHRTLVRLIEALSYLGRAESICEAALADPPAESDDWVRPLATSGRAPEDDVETVNVLIPDREVTLDQLEVTTDGMRKAGRTTPAGARWVIYERPQTDRREPPKAPARPAVHAVRWALGTSHPFAETSGILAASALRWRIMKILEGKQPDLFKGHPGSALIAGQHGDTPALDHHHAHWLFLTENKHVTGLALWVPAEGGIPPEFVDRLLGSWTLPRFARAPSGYVPGELYFEAAGNTDRVLPEFGGRARTWRTVTPVTTTRYQKNASLERFWTKTIQRELSQRRHFEEVPEVISVSVEKDSNDGSLRGWRRYRWNENLGQSRRAAMLTVHLDRDVQGPVVLGDLGHFGLGLFEPTE